MKKTLVKSIKISFQEKTSKGFVDRSFDTPKETVGTNAEVSPAGRWPSGGVGGGIWNGNTAPAVLDAWHLSQMKKSPDFIRGVSYRNI